MGTVCNVVATFVLLASTLAAAGCDSDFGTRTPTDSEIIGNFQRNSACFREMAARALAAPKWRFVEYRDLDWTPQFHQSHDRVASVPSNEVQFWARCMRAGYVKSVFPSTIADQLVWTDGVERKRSPGDEIVWFYVFNGGLAVGASERKGVLFIPGDARLLTEIGSIERSTDKYNWSLPNREWLESHRKIFRRIDEHWFVFYDVNN